jgi:hypothetical protein
MDEQWQKNNSSSKSMLKNTLKTRQRMCKQQVQAKP